MNNLSRSLHRHALRLSAAFALLTLAGTLSAATLCVNPGGTGGCQSTITAAIVASVSGDTIEVQQGTYAPAIITKSIALVAAAGATPIIDATGKSNGIVVSGITSAPNAGIGYAVVSGFEVRNANYEGILVVNASDVNVVNNHVHDNNKALKPSVTASMCPGIPAWETSEAMDCGEGIHLIAVDHSYVINNLVENNSGGILITDETGPTTDNVIKGNIVHDNGYACGITMASHPAANASGPIKALNFGISHNVISQNQSYDNGLLLPGAGAGVGIFAPGPGSTNTANAVIYNLLYGNGLPGVTMHNHAAVLNAPPVVFNDNVIVGNTIFGNAADTADAHTAGTTGINVYSVARMDGTVIAENTIEDESIAIAFNAPKNSRLIAHFNNFAGQGTGIDNIGAGFIDATNNYWGCADGPSASCNTATGSEILTIPFLTQAFGSN
jgi:hypothetical protein